MGTAWLSPFPPLNVTVSYYQSNAYWGPGPTPVVASYFRGGSEGTPSFLLVYTAENGLHYRYANSYSSGWSIPSNDIVPGSYGSSSQIWFPSLASYNSQDLRVNLIYGVRFGSPNQIYSQIFNDDYPDGSWLSRVAVDWIGTYNRYPSLALNYANSTLGVWSGWNGSKYSIRFRQGFADGSWSNWAKEWVIPEVNSFHPVITYYKKPNPYPYGIDILWHTSSNQIRQKKYYGIGDNWIPTDPSSANLIANNGLYANISHERQNTTYPIQMWTDQSTPPIYSILYNSAFLPKEELWAEGEIRRAAEVTDASGSSYLRIELSEPIITTSNNEKVRIPFKEYDYLTKLNLSTSNVFDYLQTEMVSIPNNADLISFEININAAKPDTLLDGSLNTNNQTPFQMINFALSARDSSSIILLNNIGNQLLNNPSGLHNFSNEFTLNATALRGKSIHFVPGVNLTGSFNTGNLHFTLVNVAIEGSGLAKDSTEIIKDNLILLDYSLEQNYPNPFNPVTKIRYSILEDGFVSMKVYDVLGREVATLLNEEKPAGTYTVTFDAKGFSSGIYLYSLKVNNYIACKKMILIK